MVRVQILTLTVILLASRSHVAAFSEENYNFSMSGFAWATAKDGDELEREREFRDQTLGMVEEGLETESGEGFPSLDSMLQWAIGHSDPDKLKDAAQDVQKLSSSELEQRRAEIKELMEKLRLPSDTELAKIAITDLQNSSLPVEYRQRALQELLELVGPIDNANDLDKLGGLTVVVQELDREEDELRTTAAWVLGKASQNNPLVQNQILQLGVLPKLMSMVRSSCIEEAVKALYAVSAVIRNYPLGQEGFYLEGGGLLLQELMSNTSTDIRLRRKSVSLVADLAEQQLEVGSSVLTFQPSESFLKSVVDLMQVPDLDTQEKALMAIKSLGRLSDATHAMLKDVCHVKDALEKMRLQLQKSLIAEGQTQFSMDMEVLHQAVESTFSEDEVASS